MENISSIFSASPLSSTSHMSLLTSLDSTSVLGSSHEMQNNNVEVVVGEEKDRILCLPMISNNNIMEGPSSDNISHVSQNNGTVAGGEGEDKSGKMIKKGEKKAKKPKYAFQTRSQVDILDDGYRWRKYGQKSVKNNNFPRSYYRCTHQGCNVKKQVQRLSKDEGVVVTTYEGMHSHPIEKSTDNFEHILTQMQIYNSF